MSIASPRFRDLSSLSRLLRLTAGIWGAVSTGGFLIVVALYFAASYSETDSDAATSASRAEVVAVWLALWWLSLLTFSVVFLIWKYRALYNAHALGGSSLPSPAAAIYWYFVPIASLWMPYVVMRRIFQASYPPASPGEGKPSLSLVTAWWVLWLLYFLVSSPRIWGILEEWSFLLSFVFFPIPLAVVTARMSSTLEEWQRAKYQLTLMSRGAAAQELPTA